MFFEILGWFLLFVIGILFFPRTVGLSFAIFFILARYEVPEESDLIHWITSMSWIIVFIFDIYNIKICYDFIFDN